MKHIALDFPLGRARCELHFDFDSFALALNLDIHLFAGIGLRDGRQQILKLADRFTVKSGDDITPAQPGDGARLSNGDVFDQHPARRTQTQRFRDFVVHALHLKTDKTGCSPNGFRRNSHESGYNKYKCDQF